MDILKKADTEYWTHNTAYHKWIMKHIYKNDRVLDVGCGDGLLIERVSKKCSYAVGIEPYLPCAIRAQNRLKGTENAKIEAVSFEKCDFAPNSFDAVIFMAALHHMDLELLLKKAKWLLKPNGRLIVVGCAMPKGFVDFAIEGLRVLPAKIGSFLHGEKNGGNIGAPVNRPNLSLKQIRRSVKSCLPDAKIRRGLYYRYLLLWTKQTI